LNPPVPPPGFVTWIKVDKPVFDLVGVVVSSFEIAGIVAFLALALGAVLGSLLILRQRRPLPADHPSAALRLGTSRT
jgi:hypothetical protein